MKLKYLAACAFIVANALFSQALTKPFEVNGIYYQQNGNWYEDEDTYDMTVAVIRLSNTYYDDYSTLVNIPSTVTNDGKTYTVTRIEHDAFVGDSKLKTVIFPKTLQEIGYQAFMYATNIESIVFSSNGELASIDRDAFYHCKKITSLNLPTSLKTIGEGVFEGCTALKTINWGNSSVETIGKTAFKGCDNIEEVVIPNSVKSIGEMAFWTCSKLRKVTIGSSVEYIGPDAFLDNNTLEEVDFSKNNCLKELGYEAFRGCWNITDIQLPNSVTTMGYSVFKYCVSLRSIKLGESLTEIPSQAFVQSDLECITIPNSVKSIGAYAFQECLKLSKVNFGNGLEYIGVAAFELCSSLEQVILPEPLAKIDGYAFYNCSNLKFVSIPRTTSYFSNEAFGHCSSLENVNDLATTPQDIFSLGLFAQSGPENGRVTVHVYEGLYDIYSTTLGWYDIGTEYASNITIVDDLPIVAISAIKFTENPIYCGIGAQKTATITIEPQDATSTELVWSSSDESILYVDMYSGTFIGLDYGEATLTVTDPKSGVSASAKVIVKDDAGVNDITIDSNSAKEDVIYDLYGRRQNSLRPGLNIVNGKKIFIK